MTETLLRFVHLSDTHLSPDPNYGAGRHGSPHSSRAGAEALVRAVNALPFRPDFILHTGDVVYDPDPAAYAVAQTVLGALQAPVYYVAGNHDHGPTLQATLGGIVAPAASYYYEREINGLQLLVLDSNGPAEPPRGYIPDEQLDWLRERTSAVDARPLIVAVHHHLLPVNVPWLDGTMRTTNGEAVHAALLPARERLRGVFFGHVHQPLEMLRDGILYASAASSWCQFHAYPDQAEDTTLADSNSRPGFSIVTVTRQQTYLRRCQFAVG
jgi:Icc protein